MEPSPPYLRQLAASPERDGLDGLGAPSPAPEPLPAPDDGESAGADDHPFSLPAKRTEAETRSPPLRLLTALFLLSSTVAGALVWSGHAPFPTLLILTILIGAYFLIVSTTITRLCRPGMVSLTLLLCGLACLLVDVLSLLFHLAAPGR